MRALLERYVAPLARRVRLSIGLAILDLVDDAAGQQAVQLRLLDGEVAARVRRVQNYGFTSVPLKGAQAVALAVGGNRSHLVAVAVDDARYRKRGLEPGEVALYTDEGDSIVLKRGRIVEVIAGTRVDVTAPEAVVNAASKVALNTPSVECSGNLSVTGNVVVGGDLTVAGEATIGGIAFTTHVHGGVVAGSSTTSPPQ